MGRPVRPSLGCGYAISIFIALLGCIALVAAARNLLAPDSPAAATAFVVPAAIGFLLITASIAYLRAGRRIVREYEKEQQIRTDNPDSPWLWHREWRGEHLACEAFTTTRMLWLFAGAWNAISFTALVQVIAEPSRTSAAWFVFLFPVIGLGLLSLAAYQTIRRRKYGRVRFTPVSLPGLIGGHLGGVIEIPARVVPLAPLRLALRCIRKTIVGSGKNRRTVETVLWESEQRIPAAQLAATLGLTTISVLFEIPAGQPATDLDVSENRILWLLTAEAETPGVDFFARFHVPVFPAGGPGLAAPLPEAGRSSAAPPLDAAELTRYGVTRLADGWRFASPHLHGARLGSTLVCTALLTLTIVLIVRGAHPVAFGANLLTLLITAAFCYNLWHARAELRIVGDAIMLSRSVWFRSREIRLLRSELADVLTEENLSIGTTQYYRLVLVGLPVGPSRTASGPSEPFATRKLRSETARAAPADQASGLSKLAAAQRFRVRFAGHIPGPFFAGNLRNEILSRLTS